MRNIKLTIEYDGTAYHGWQSQVNAATIQDIVNSAVNRLTGEVCTLYGSSRTDAGVHSYGQVANFRTTARIPADRIAFALNILLPYDIVIVKSEEADPDFHARFCAKGKRYRYLFYNSMLPSALLRNRAWNVHYPLNVEAMREASEYFLGTHDFMAFSSSGGSVKTTVRNISSISLARIDSSLGKLDKGTVLLSKKERQENRPLVLENRPLVLLEGQGTCSPVPVTLSLDIEGNGFLYNMVRIIAGTLVEVGYGKIEPGEIVHILESRDRKRAGTTAPPQGLYLMEVIY